MCFSNWVSHCDRNGFIAEKGDGKYDHVFGGNLWTGIGPLDYLDKPALLLTLDLSDPLLNYEFSTDIKQLPLFSYINIDLTPDRQRYEIDFENKCVNFIKLYPILTHSGDPPQRLWEDGCFVFPLPSIRLVLRKMNALEMPKDEDSYWKACETFLGKSFLRVDGPIVWLQFKEEVVCDCGREMNYVASIGCEYNKNDCLMETQEFFIGELVLYFFYCDQCRIVEGISQST